MLRLIDLKRYLQGTGLVNPERIEATVESGTPQFSCSFNGPDLLLFRNLYEGVIEIEGAAGDIEDVLAQVLVWVNENGGDDDRLIEWEGEPVDNNRADITLRFAFEEEVHYIPAGAGYTGKDKITVNGTDYKRGTAVADSATTLDGVSGATSP
mgnify:CR=1 FL=1